MILHLDHLGRFPETADIAADPIAHCPGQQQARDKDRGGAAADDLVRKQPAGDILCFKRSMRTSELLTRVHTVRKIVLAR